MTPLDLSRPLASLLDASGMTHDALARAHKPRVSREAVSMAVAKGDRIKLSTLASYARAAGYVLRLRCDRWIGGHAVKVPAPGYGRVDGLDGIAATVEQASVLLASLGLEMTLAVDPV